MSCEKAARPRLKTNLPGSREEMNSFIVKYDAAYLFLSQGKVAVIHQVDLEKVLEHHWYAHQNKKHAQLRSRCSKRDNHANFHPAVSSVA